MGEPLTNPDSQSDTQEAIQSEWAKGTPLIQTQLIWSILETHWDTVDEDIPTQKRNPVLVSTITLTNVLDPIYVHNSPTTEVKRERMIMITTQRKPCAHNGTEKPEWTQDNLHKILTRLELWPGWKPRSSTDSCPSTIESRPTAGQSRHHSEVWSPMKRNRVVTQHSQTTMSDLTGSQDTRTGIQSCLEVDNKTHEDLQVQIHRKITKTPQHRHCFVRKPMIK